MHVKTKRDDLINYLTDASNLTGGHAEMLYLPETPQEISEILAEANNNKIPVTVSGARTGTVGGAVPFGGIVISMERFNEIGITSSDQGNTAVAGAGAMLADVQKAADQSGLFYPPDPTEWSCQIGGTVATNASGARSFKYGATRKYVERMEIVLADGDLLSLRRGQIFGENGAVSVKTKSGKIINAKLPTYDPPNVRKNTSGYYSGPGIDAVDLFIGSEGTLGIIYEVELDLLEKAHGFLSGIVFFPTESDLLGLVSEARELSFSARKKTKNQVRDHQNNFSIDAAGLEYFDKKSLEFIAGKFPDTPSGMAGAIFFEQETSESNEDQLLEAWNRLLEKHRADLEQSWFAVNEKDLEKMREFRHALPVSVNERIVKYKQRKVGTDMAVPDENFPSFLRFYKEKLSKSGLDYVIFGHIGDNHLHANMIPKNEDEARIASQLYGRFIAQAIMLGGTVSAEHGIGKLKAKYLKVMYGERYLNEMAELKSRFDINGILGQGNMFDSEFLGEF